MILFNSKEPKNIKEEEIKMIRKINNVVDFQGKLKMVIHGKTEVNHIIELKDGNLLLLELEGVLELFTKQGKLLKSSCLKDIILCGIEWKENIVVCAVEKSITFFDLNDCKVLKEYIFSDSAIYSIVDLPNDEFACGNEKKNFLIFNQVGDVLYQKDYPSQVTRLWKMNNGNIIIPTFNGLIDFFDPKNRQTLKCFNIEKNINVVWDFIELKIGYFSFISYDEIFVNKEGVLIHKILNNSGKFSPMVESNDGKIIVRNVKNLAIYDVNLNLIQEVHFNTFIEGYKLVKLSSGNIVSVNYSNLVEIYE